MNIYKIRLGGPNWMIHVISTTKPYLSDTGELCWTPSNSLESDKILKLDWNEISVISYREHEVKEDKVVDLNSLKTVTSNKDNKKYVLLTDVEKLLRNG